MQGSTRRQVAVEISCQQVLVIVFKICQFDAVSLRVGRLGTIVARIGPGDTTGRLKWSILTGKAEFQPDENTILQVVRHRYVETIEADVINIPMYILVGFLNLYRCID